MENERCHVTVVGARRRVDLAIPADAAIAEYAPTLLTLVGQVESDETFPPVWSLALPGTAPLSPESSLRESGIVDGAILYLRDAAAGESDEPVVTDLEESVENAEEDVTAWGWRPRAYTTMLLGLLSSIAGFVTLAATGDRDTVLPATGAGAIIIAFALTMLTWHATRKGWSLPLSLRLIMAYSAVPLLAVAAVSLPAADTSTASVLTALSAGALLGALAGLLALRHATTLMAVAITGVTLSLTVGLNLADASLTEASAVVAVSMMAVLSAAPKVSGHFAVLAGTPGDGAEAYGAEADVLHLVSRGRRLLVGTNVLGSLVAAACLVILGTTDRPFEVALACCLGLALVLRAGRLTMAPAVVPMVTAGVVGLTATLIRAPGNFGAPYWAGPVALLVAALLTMTFGLARAFRADGSAARPSWIDPLAGFLLLASVPLAVGIFDVYTSLLDSGQTP